MASTWIITPEANAKQKVHRAPAIQTLSGPTCQIVTVDQGPSRSIGSPVAVRRVRTLEAQLPALRRRYPSRSLDIVCEGGE